MIEPQIEPVPDGGVGDGLNRAGRRANRAERRALARECRREGHLVKVMVEGRYCVRCLRWLTETES